MRITIRRALLKIHMVLGLALGALVVTTSLTGAALVYRSEIDVALNPEHYATTAGDVGFEGALRAVKQAHPSAPIDIIWAPGEKEKGVYVAMLLTEPLLYVHVDPGSGRILTARDEDQTLMGWVFNLHMYLLAGDAGQYVVGTGGIGLLLLVVTGCYLWWPGVKKLSLGFALRRRKTGFVFTYDLHKLVGIVVAPALALMVTTGVLLTFYNVGSYLIHGLLLTERAEEPGPDVMKSAAGGTVESLSLNDVSARAERHVPGGRTSAIAPPLGPEDAIKLWVRLPGDPRPNVGGNLMWLDQYSGAVLWERDPKTASLASEIDEKWVITLHFGTLGGEPVRLLYCLAGLTPTTLLVTGLVLWTLKRRNKTLGRTRRNNRVTKSPNQHAHLIDTASD
jgi:uncharacterized iron-regulated membrane protein